MTAAGFSPRWWVVSCLLTGVGPWTSAEPLIPGVRVDSRRREVIIVAGPFRLRPAPHHMDHMSSHMMGGDSLVTLFPWPVTTVLQDLRLELRDGTGRPVPRRLLHHLNLVNFDRRQLVYPLVERLMGFGQETEDVSVPKSIGIPIRAGDRVGVYVMWDPEMALELDDVYVRLVFRWAPRNLQPRPIQVMPFIIDANLVAGGHNTFTVPPGGCSRTYDFTFPVSGHLIAASGHLHDHGLWLRLVDAVSGKVVVTVKAKRDSVGRVLAMSRELLALRGEGPRLRANHAYRLEARYDNPTPDTLRGMMGMMVGLFAPDDFRRWPAIDRSHPDYRRDLASLLGDRDLLPEVAGPERRF